MTISDRSWYWHLCSASLSAMGLAITTSGDCAIAQIRPDGTLGAENSVVTPTNINGLPTERIEGGAVRGTNLFHSFEEFSVPTGSAAYFNNAADIQNIISRVTGESISNIDGLIRANASANLFLLNPNGIIFGSNASLSIGGSFVATTANAVRLGETGLFSASLPATSNLLTVSPSALFFNAVAAQAIVNQSQAQSLSRERFSGEVNSRNVPVVGLQVPTGKTLALVGGNVFLQGGNLTAFGGRIELGSVAGVGEVSLSQSGDSWLLGYDKVDAFGNIRVDDGAFVEVSGRKGGNLQLQGAQLEMTQADIFADTYSKEAGGEVLIHTTEGITLSNGSFIGADVLGSGTGGNLTITTGKLIVRDGSAVSTLAAGSGQGGALAVNASESVELIAGSPDQQPTGFYAGGILGVGTAGTITIKTEKLVVQDGAQVFASTTGQGNAGNIQVNATNSVNLSGVDPNGYSSSLSSSTSGVGQAGNITVNTSAFRVADGGVVDAQTTAGGNGGNITVNGNTFFAVNGGQVLSTTRSSGRAGNITLNVTDSVTLAGSDPTYFERRTQFGEDVVRGAGPASGLFSNTAADSTGNGGTIEVNTTNLSISDGASIGINSSGRGSAGSSLRINARDAVALDNSLISSSLGPEAVGQGGNIEIQTELLSLTNSSQAEAATFGQGDAGRISVRAADSVSLSDSSISTAVNASAVGQGGNIDIQTGSLSLDNSAQVSASTAGQGNAGGIKITAQNAVAVANSSTISSGVETGASGDGGSIDIQTQTFSLTNDAQINASTQGQEDADAGNITVSASQATIQGGSQVSASTSGGDGGNITLTANTFKATNGGQLLTTTAGSKRAGDIALAVLDSVTLVGTGSGLFANTTPRSTGDGGSIFIDPRTVIVLDGAGIAVGSQGIGIGGDISLQAGSLTLDDRAFLSAETASNQGGNIALEIQDLFLLRRGSQISATAGTAKAGGDGGNITIWAPFIVAVPSENSDISANAFTGNGGKVEITSKGIFGIQSREQPTPKSDISASSTGGGINGVVTINTPDVDPSRGLVNLPAELVDASNQIAQSCPSGVRQGESKFIVTGRGGLPPNPSDLLNSDAVWVDLDSTTQLAQNRSSSEETTQMANSTKEPLVEATGWEIDDKGQVVLIASAPTATPDSPELIVAKCYVP